MLKITQVAVNEICHVIVIIYVVFLVVAVPLDGVGYQIVAFVELHLVVDQVALVVCPLLRLLIDVLFHEPLELIDLAENFWVDGYLVLKRPLSDLLLNFFVNQVLVFVVEI